MSEVKWIKIATNIFDNKKIRIIESMPDGDSIIVIWFKLLMLAGNVNDGGAVYFTKDIPYTEQMLSTLFDRPLTTVQLALNTFEKFKMIEIVNEIIQVSNWEKYQNVEGMERIREQTRLRVSKYREAKKLECNATCNVTVTHGNAIDIEEDIDKDNKDILSGKPDTEPKEITSNLVKEIVDYLNLKTGSHFKATTPKTKTLINARLKEGFTVDNFKTVIDKKFVEWGSDSKMVQYLRPETLFGTKFEGYLNQKAVKKAVKNTFNEMIHTAYDFDELERMALND